MELLKLKEVCKLLNGYAFKSPKYVEHGIRIIRIANVQDGFIVDEEPCFYPNDAYVEIEKYMLKENDLLISLTGNVGRVGVLGKKLLPAALNQRVGCIRPLEGRLTVKYLYYFLRQRSFMDDCTKSSKGVAQLNLSTKWLENYTLPVPTLDEQKRIVERIEELFSELDKAEETLLKIKSQLEIYKQAVLKEAFEDFSDGAKVEIDSIVDDIRIGPFGTMLHKEDYVTGGIPVINPQHIKNLKIVPTSNVTISVEKAEELNSYRLRPNDIIMGRRGQMGRTAHITENEDGWICGTGSITFRMKKEFSAEFYAKVLSSPEVVRYLEENATGTTMKNLNEKIVKHIPVPYLTRKQQDALIGELDYKISICTNTNKCIDVTLLKLKSLRQSILKEAFEGKLV